MLLIHFFRLNKGLVFVLLLMSSYHNQHALTKTIVLVNINGLCISTLWSNINKFLKWYYNNELKIVWPNTATNRVNTKHFLNHLFDVHYANILLYNLSSLIFDIAIFNMHSLKNFLINFFRHRMNLKKVKLV